MILINQFLLVISLGYLVVDELVSLVSAPSYPCLQGSSPVFSIPLPLDLPEHHELVALAEAAWIVAYWYRIVSTSYSSTSVQEKANGTVNLGQYKIIRKHLPVCP